VLRERSCFDPNGGKKMFASDTSHVNHSINDADAQRERQADPHSHAVILDPFFGRLAFVPDLGKDVIRQFLFSPENGNLTDCGAVPAGPSDLGPLGPRYIEFHPTLPVCYVVNELASIVSVFQFDMAAATSLVQAGKGGTPTLRLVQNVLTIPPAFPKHMNTCGRITVHKTGDHVLCSNRGHDSIAVYKIHPHSDPPGLLSLEEICHTEGETPRHFQFDPSGQWLIAANQDSDSLSVFRFNIATGSLESTHAKYKIPSPNFVCADLASNTLPVQFQPSAATKVHDGLG